MVGSLGWRSYKFSQQFFFLLKTIYYLNLNFFRLLQSTLLKSEKKISKKWKPPKEMALHSKRYKKIFKKERGKKNEKTSNNNSKYFFTLTILNLKIYIL